MSLRMLLFYLLHLFVIQTLAERCLTPNYKEGQCVPLTSCPEVMNAFANVKRGTEAYLRQFICNDKEPEVKVCCDPSSEYKNFRDDNTISENVESPAPEVDFQEVRHCGPINFPRENNASLQLAEIRAIDSGSNAEYTKCLGSLINPRYVVTAAECLVQKHEKNRSTIVAVRFIVHTKNKKSYKYYGIEQEIIHPFYNIVKGFNNIALLRIHRTVVKGDNIEPSCLRSPSLYLIPEPGFQDTTTSAGKTKTSSSCDWKPTLTKLISNEDCKRELESRNVEEILTPYKFCTTDIQNSTELECDDRPGTPVLFLIMNNVRDGWLGGISSSETVCGAGVPNVYTDANAYFDWIFENMQPWPINSEECTTVNGERGSYISIRYCPQLLDTFTNPENGTEERLRKYIKNEEDFIVCCNLSLNNTSSISDSQNITIPKDVLSLKAYCGFQHRDDYPVDTDNITINEFPWIAYIAVRIPGEYEPDHPQCIGTLINTRYVLTSAFCVDTWKYINIVRLGEFSTKSPTDCVVDDTGKECSSIEDYGIEEKIIHPFYMLNYSSEINNIALLRLNKSVGFSDYIRPLCLPLPDVNFAKVGDTLYTSGFGYDRHGVFHDLKKKIPSTLVSNNKCRQNLTLEYVKVFVNPNVVCTQEFRNNTEYACGYDGGAPLMFVNKRRQWHVEGILSSEECGKRPARHVRISKYLKWIIGNMRPSTPH